MIAVIRKKIQGHFDFYLALQIHNKNFVKS